MKRGLTLSGLAVLLFSRASNGADSHLATQEIRAKAVRVAQASGIIGQIVNSRSTWQKLPPDQREEFEKACVYNQALLETVVVEELIGEFPEVELDNILAFHESPGGVQWTTFFVDPQNENYLSLYALTKDWQKQRYEEAYYYRFSRGQRTTFVFDERKRPIHPKPSKHKGSLTHRVLEKSGIMDKRLAFYGGPWVHMSDGEKARFEGMCVHGADALLDLLAPFMEQHFTRESLQEVADFFETRTGVHWKSTMVSANERNAGYWGGVHRWKYFRDMELYAFSKSSAGGVAWAPDGYASRLLEPERDDAPTFTGKSPVNILGGTREDFTALFGRPVMTEKRTEDILALEAPWPPYHVSATVGKGKITALHFSRDATMSTDPPARPSSWPGSEVEAFLKEFQGEGVWSAWVNLGSYIEGQVCLNEAEQIRCVRRPSVLNFFIGPPPKN